MRFLGPTFGLRAALLAGGIAVAAAFGNQVGASADSVMTVPVMGQQEAGWASANLGTSPASIGLEGCAITSVAMMLRYYGINTDPNALNAWLTANGGYANDDMLIWDAITRYTGGRVAFSGWLGPDLNTILAELDAGRPVVAEVSIGGNQHFVLLTGYSTDGGIQMNDPWYFDSAKLNDRYGYPNSGIVSIRTFMPADVRRGMNWLANAVAAVHLSQ